jgi:hypothetical protein
MNNNTTAIDVERRQISAEGIFSENLSVHRLTEGASIRPRSDFHQRKSLRVNDFHPAKPDGTCDRNPHSSNERGISLALCQLPKLLKVDGHDLSPYHFLDRFLALQRSPQKFCHCSKFGRQRRWRRKSALSAKSELWSRIFGIFARKTKLPVLAVAEFALTQTLLLCGLADNAPHRSARRSPTP